MKTLNYIHLNSESVKPVINSLHQLLADYQVFYTNLRGFHWNIKGPYFFQLHGKFEELYNNIAEKCDEIAERILMLGGVPSSRFSDYLKVSKIEELGVVSDGNQALDYILEKYGYFIGEERRLLHTASEAGDEATVAILSDYLREQEKLVWMLTAYRS